LNWRLHSILALCSLLCLLGCSSEKLFYKTVPLGEHCTFSIPFLWKKKDVTANLPAQVKKQVSPNVAAFTSSQIIGKEVMVSVNYAKLKKNNANIAGVIAESLRQLSLLPNTTDLEYACEPYIISGGKAQLCRIKYKRGKEYMLAKLFCVVPDDDLTVSYYFAGFYSERYKWGDEVLDKLYRSVELK